MKYKPGKKLIAILLLVALIFTMEIAAAGAQDARADTSGGFPDVPADSWYSDAVDYAVRNGLMNGMEHNTFQPNTTMTRAMLVTVLWRQEGSQTGNANRFTDVPSGTWYTDAVAWANAEEIVNGTTATEFSPEDHVTREQMVTILYRYAQYKAEDTAARNDLQEYPDAGSVSNFARTAMQWAVAEGIINGSNGNLLPRNTATRAEVATILYRYFTAHEQTPDESESSDPTDASDDSTEPSETEPTEPTEPIEPPIASSNPIPQELAEIPTAYYSAAERQGDLVELYYDTYESFSYSEKTQRLTKRAIVYLPYGYDESRQYNIFYLMHGGWSNETTTLGTPAQPSAFKNVIDHAIEAGEIEPLILVCPTYNNTSPEDSASFSLALRLNINYHNELVNDLIPAVESRYSTYAASTAEADLIASRDHRGFGGFSMGSVATWRTFEHCLDYFHYFLPMSCGTTLDDETIFAAADGRPQSDYFVWVMTGTDDFAYSYDNNRVEKMRNSPYFTEADNERDGNFAYRVKEGYNHGGLASVEYTYNGLRWFWSDQNSTAPYTENTKISDVADDPIFGDYGRLIFPVNAGYWSGDTLGDLRLTWYSNIDPNKTVEICNYMKTHAEAGETIFYDIYTDAEKAADPAKADTGLFFFKGNPGEKFAVCNAGGGFAYVGAMHDSFPHALELSKLGYNAFALIYRPGWDTAMEDLSRAISFIFAHADELEVDTDCYSLWGGSAGARMAADVGSYGTAAFGGDDLPQAGCVVMQYTGHSEWQRTDPPTYACVGTGDGIANWRTMQSRIEAMSAAGIPTEFHAYEGLPHGFGLGTGTVAEGWIYDAVAFWEEQM